MKSFIIFFILTMSLTASGTSLFLTLTTTENQNFQGTFVSVGEDGISLNAENAENQTSSITLPLEAVLSVTYRPKNLTAETLFNLYPLFPFLSDESQCNLVQELESSALPHSKRFFLLKQLLKYIEDSSLQTLAKEIQTQLFFEMGLEKQFEKSLLDLNQMGKPLNASARLCYLNAERSRMRGDDGRALEWALLPSLQAGDRGSQWHSKCRELINQIYPDDSSFVDK